MLLVSLVCLHLLALLTATVFLSSRSALLRPETFSLHEQVVPVLRRLDRVYWVALLTLGLSGILLMLFGAAGTSPSGHNIFLDLMALGWVFLVILAWSSTRRLRAFADGRSNVDEQAWRRLRSALMGQGHLIALITILGVLVLFGYGQG